MHARHPRPLCNFSGFIPCSPKNREKPRGRAGAICVHCAAHKEQYFAKSKTATLIGDDISEHRTNWPRTAFIHISYKQSIGGRHRGDPRRSVRQSPPPRSLRSFLPPSFLGIFSLFPPLSARYSLEAKWYAWWVLSSGGAAQRSKTVKSTAAVTSYFEFFAGIRARMSTVLRALPLLNRSQCSFFFRGDCQRMLGGKENGQRRIGVLPYKRKIEKMGKRERFRNDIQWTDCSCIIMCIFFFFFEHLDSVSHCTLYNRSTCRDDCRGETQDYSDQSHQTIEWRKKPFSKL